MDEEEQRLLAAVCATPDDDAPRLAYAAWCDRRGDPRGEFIRVQVELAKFGRNTDSNEWQSLDRKSWRLLDVSKNAWLAPIVDIASDPEFHRGFITQVTMRAQEFLEKYKLLYSTAPIQHITLKQGVVLRQRFLNLPLYLKYFSPPFPKRTLAIKT